MALQVLQNGTRVGLLLHGRPAGDLAWDEAVELGHVLFRRGFDSERDPSHVAIYQLGHRQVRMAGGRITVLYHGGVVADMEAGTARALGRALIAIGRKSEEWAKAEEVAADAAVLMRAGVSVGLANHPDVQKEAVKHALHDRDLRRFMSNNVSERSVVGTPALFQGAKES